MPSEAKLSPLFRLAIKSGATDAVSMHIRRGEAANGRDGFGMTPLMIAAVNGHLDVCARLLDLGANPSLVSAGGKTADELAIDHGHAALSEFLTQVRQPTVDTNPASGPAVYATPSAFSFGHPPNAGPALSVVSSEVIAIAGAPLRISEQPFVAVSDNADPVEGGDSVGVGHGWVADDCVPSGHDDECAVLAIATQRLIATHRRTSDEIDWSDIELELPEARVTPSPHPRDDLGAIARLIATGLQVGYITTADLNAAIETDCPAQSEHTQVAVESILDDLGILIEPSALPFPLADADRHDDDLDAALDALCAKLAEPRDIFITYAAESRKYDLIKREDEERLGRRMDSALGALTRALAALCELDWQLVFAQSPPQRESFARGLVEAEVAGDEAETVGQEEVSEDGDAEKFDFPTYVQLVRQGAPENGRDASVPRPSAAQLARLLDVAAHLNAGAANAVISSVGAFEAARDQLITANLRLATSLAHGYRNRGLPLEDLVQDANIGLMRAAERYDFRRGFKFSTYATWWIRQNVGRALMDTARMIRVPVHVVEKINTVNRTRRELQYGRMDEVGVDEIASRMSVTAEQIRRIIRADCKVLSFDECGPGREPHTPDPANIVDPAADPTQSSFDRSLSMVFARMLAEFDKRDRAVIVARYGLDGSDSKTLEEVGQHFNVTRERIRQIEAKVLRKFQHSSRRDVLMPYATFPVPVKESRG